MPCSLHTLEEGASTRCSYAKIGWCLRRLKNDVSLRYTWLWCATPCLEVLMARRTTLVRSASSFRAALILRQLKPTEKVSDSWPWTRIYALVREACNTWELCSAYSTTNLHLLYVSLSPDCLLLKKTLMSLPPHWTFRKKKVEWLDDMDIVASI